MAVSAPVVYRFSGFQLDPMRRLLFDATGQPIPLKPKVFATLLYLVERPGELVNKEEVLAAVWPNVVVEENSLNKAISTLRHVLGETRGEHRYIVTEPGRGYRFVASVEAIPPATLEQPHGRDEAAVVTSAIAMEPSSVAVALSEASRRFEMKGRETVWTALAIALGCVVTVSGLYWLASVPTPDTRAAATPVPPPSANSVAVLPFVNLSPDPNDAYFAIGVHEELLNQLTKIGDLQVTSRTSVQSYAGTQKATSEIARELNVSSVLDGSVRYADGRVVVTTRLNDGPTNTTLWSESYEREFSNIFAIQSDVALNVARALSAELLPVEREQVTRVPTESLRAYDLYLSVTARISRGTTDETLLAVKEAEEAIALDPDFALAWLAKARARTLAQILDPAEGDEHRELGEQAARRAIELDPSLGMAYATLGMALATRRQWVAAERAYRTALDLKVPLGDPNGYNLLQMYVGNFSYARQIFEEARVTTPQEPTVLRFLILANALLGDWQTAVAQYELGTRLFQPWRGADEQMLHLRISRQEVEDARHLRVNDPINATMMAHFDSPQSALRELRRLYAQSGPGNPNDRRNVSLWAGYFGDTGLALEAMRAAINEQGAQAVYLWLPQLKEMRQLPQFKAFLREVGIVEHWREFGWPAICQPLSDDDFVCG